MEYLYLGAAFIVGIIFVYCHLKSILGGDPKMIYARSEEPKKQYPSDDEDEVPGMQRKKGVNMLRPYSLGNGIDVVGESNYLTNLMNIRSQFGDRIIATLVPEPTNEHDSNAILVEVSGLTVGYLSRADALKFHRVYRNVLSNGRPIECYGQLFGGTKGKANIGVKLDFNLNDEVVYKRDPK